MVADGGRTRGERSCRWNIVFALFASQDTPQAARFLFVTFEMTPLLLISDSERETVQETQKEGNRWTNAAGDLINDVKAEYCLGCSHVS